MMRELRRRTETDDTSGAFEGVDTTPHTQDLLALIGSLVNVGEGPSDRVEIILSFEPEPFDEFIRSLILTSCGDVRLVHWGATDWGGSSVSTRLGRLGVENSGVGAKERLR
jgi:hypothetical protein